MHGPGIDLGQVKREITRRVIGSHGRVRTPKFRIVFRKDAKRRGLRESFWRSDVQTKT